MYYLFFQDRAFKENNQILLDKDIQEVENINIRDLPENICRGVFDIETISNAINDCTFVLFGRGTTKTRTSSSHSSTRDMIHSIMCVTYYNFRGNNMWEISYLCSAESAKGMGGILLSKIKDFSQKIANKMKQSIVIYALTITERSRVAFAKSGFSKDEMIDSQIVITPQNRGSNSRRSSRGSSSRGGKRRRTHHRRARALSFIILK